MSAGIGAYTARARVIAAEIREEVVYAADEPDTPYEALAGMTFDDWLDFRETAEDQILRYAAATPFQRQSRKWTAPIGRLRLAAYQTCLIAVLLLEQADLLQPGDSYRRTLRRAAEAALQLRREVGLLQAQGYDGEILPLARR